MCCYIATGASDLLNDAFKNIIGGHELGVLHQVPHTVEWRFIDEPIQSSSKPDVAADAVQLSFARPNRAIKLAQHRV